MSTFINTIPNKKICSHIENNIFEYQIDYETIYNKENCNKENCNKKNCNKKNQSKITHSEKSRTVKNCISNLSKDLARNYTLQILDNNNKVLLTLNKNNYTNNKMKDNITQRIIQYLPDDEKVQVDIVDSINQGILHSIIKLLLFKMGINYFAPGYSNYTSDAIFNFQIMLRTSSAKPLNDPIVKFTYYNSTQILTLKSIILYFTIYTPNNNNCEIINSEYEIRISFTIDFLKKEIHYIADIEWDSIHTQKLIENIPKYITLSTLYKNEFKNKNVESIPYSFAYYSFYLYFTKNTKNSEEIYNYIETLYKLLFSLYHNNTKNESIYTEIINDIKEKILKSFIIGRPLNYAIKLNFNDNYYNMFDISLKGIIQPNNFIPNRKITNIIFYYDYSDLQGTILLNLINNVELEYFVSCNPQIFNKNIFKKVKPFLTLQKINNHFKEEKTFIQINGTNYDSIISYINNNSLLSTNSPWENYKLPIISEYFKKLKNN